MLEHRGARTALVTTRGFRDVLELRRIRAPQLYDLFFEKPPALVERALRFEVNERMTADGTVLQPLDLQEVERIAMRLEQEEVEALAVCLLHSYSYPQHEQQIGAALPRPSAPHRRFRFRTTFCPNARNTNVAPRLLSTPTCCR